MNKFNNIVRWLNNLQTTKRLKGVYQLKTNQNYTTTHHEGRDKYCCLGVGCKLFNIKPENGWDAGSDSKFQNLVGIKDTNKIFEINDDLFYKDKDFKNVRKEIINQAQEIFGEYMGRKVQKYFKHKS